MDFNLDETQTDLRKLAVELLGREVTVARLEAHEASGAPYDTGLWHSLAQAGILGVCLPEEAGGAGLGPIELAVVLREIGGHVAPVPAEQSLVAALVIARHGSREQREALAPLADGEIVLTSALREPGRDLGAAPATTARRNGDGWVLDGVKSTVSYAAEASRILVPAVTDDGVGLFLVEPAAVTMRPVSTTTGEPAAALVLENTPGEPVGAADGAAFDELRRLALAGIIAVSSGVLAGALTLTTEYIRTRKQFGRALAEFQAVTVQIADVYIAGRALDVAVWSGAWLLAEGSPEEAETDLAVGALTVTDAALRALYICQHLHGGIGVDVTYPLHRYFSWGKHHAHLLGGVEARLDTIGARV
ncbi:acyl-CoA dehydrogenase family protein [Streptosporangium lutulentum]|uniref:Alkylation response protein AidB-like acyl-CoA dehydrogenase n=1 Tax=Streptosporangium lutulentum TaxID=1461250 RepID=A0ABT9QRC2_9ACTN|nr:acyl-CoA dehydrogenase family protein [Streptosporangium lutulentum]MDP9849300.1 alkylation response protein AidB-like acyl-CoA dehydrogenase [Streptosporangium lutulentum]